MIWDNDKAMQIDSNVAKAAKHQAIQHVCDMLAGAIQKLHEAKHQLDAWHKITEASSDEHLHLGGLFADSVIENIVDDPQIDFGRVVRECLGDEDSLHNEDWVIDRAKELFRIELQRIKPKEQI
jgi:hypothetical protein